MHYSSLFLSAAAMVSLAAAGEPSCLMGFSKTSIETFSRSFNQFCVSQSPSALIESSTFTFQGTSCDAATCVEHFNRITQKCRIEGDIISGRGEIATDSGCGKYTFQINPATSPGLPNNPQNVTVGTTFGNSTTSNTTSNPLLPPVNGTTHTPANLPTLSPQPTVVSPSTPPAATQPSASPLPTGAASIAKISGGLIVGVASIFVMFL